MYVCVCVCMYVCVCVCVCVSVAKLHFCFGLHTTVSKPSVIRTLQTKMQCGDNGGSPGTASMCRIAAAQRILFFFVGIGVLLLILAEGNRRADNSLVSF